MSIISSASSAFTLNAKSHGLFSSHTAFKKPTFNTHFNKTANDCTRLSTFVHPKDVATKQLNAVKVVVDIEDPELILCEPIKKVKISKGESTFSVLMNNKTPVNPIKSSRLTIEEVFNTPFDSKRPRKDSLGVDCFDEGSSLSFISSHSSFDNLDEETNACVNRKNSDCIITGHSDLQSLVVKDNIVGRLSYLNQGPMLFNNLESHSMFFPLSSQSACGYLGTLPKAPLCMPPNSLDEYVQFNMLNNQETFQLGLTLSDKTINELVKNSSVEEGYDSDSYATRSTSVEQEGGEASDKSQKGASPAYSGTEDLYTELQAKEDRLKAQIKKKAQRVRKQAQNKEKKGRLLNLKLDVNPKQLKVQRRLNKLQLIRYQQGANEEEDEELKKFGVFDLLSRGNSTIQECDQQIETYESNQTAPCDPLAVIPAFGEDSGRRKVTPVWNPEIIEEEKLEEFVKQLGEVLENPVNDIEAAIRLLKTYNMDSSLALEAVKENIALYAEVFRLKVKRLRRRGA